MGVIRKQILGDVVVGFEIIDDGSPMPELAEPDPAVVEYFYNRLCAESKRLTEELNK